MQRKGRAWQHWRTLSNMDNACVVLSTGRHSYESIDLIWQYVWLDENLTRKQVLEICKACKDDGVDWGSLPLYDKDMLFRWVKTLQEYNISVPRYNWQAYQRFQSEQG